MLERDNAVQLAQQLRNAVCRCAASVWKRQCPERHKAAAPVACQAVQRCKLFLSCCVSVKLFRWVAIAAAHPSALNCGSNTLGIQHQALRRRLLASRSLRRRAALFGACVHLRRVCFSAPSFRPRNVAARALPQEHDQPLKPAKRISLLLRHKARLLSSQAVQRFAAGTKGLS